MNPNRHTHKTTPKLMDMATINELLMSHQNTIDGHFFINNEIGIIRHNSQLFKLVIGQKAPFVINDHRLGIILRGTGLTNLNLVDRPLQAGQLVYLAPGTIISPISFSEDFKVFGIALFSGFTLPFPPDQISPAFNGQVRDFLLPVADDDVQITCSILEALWQVVHRPDYPRTVASSLVAALMHHYNELYRRSAEHRTDVRSHEQTIFDRFIQLVNQHCHEQHQIGYYADRICLTERYLSTIIRQTSGVTAKEWIDRALITRIKVELVHTNKSIARIADDLHFPNPSFFCKYFKRIVGMTPGAYRMR